MQKGVQITTQLSGFSQAKYIFAISAQIKSYSMPGTPEALLSLSPWGNHYPDFYLCISGITRMLWFRA